MSVAYSQPNDLAALRDYVLGPASGIQQQSESTVLLQVTHSNLKTQFIEIRMDMHMTVANVKVKLSTHCGTSPSNMALQLRDERGTPFAVLAEDQRPLGYYSPYSGCNLHIIDTDPASLSADGWLEDTSKVQKYVMSDDDYNGRENTYRKWKDSRLKEDPTWSLEKEMCLRAGREWTGGQAAARPADDTSGEAEAAALEVGQRCSVDPGDRRGIIRYVGKVEGLPAGWWVGVQYDEPVGKNDGSLQGKRFFRCPPNFGGFVRPDKLRAGDFPPHDDLDGLGSDDEI